jgi:hypothetical protein
MHVHLPDHHRANSETAGEDDVEYPRNGVSMKVHARCGKKCQGVDWHWQKHVKLPNLRQADIDEADADDYAHTRKPTNVCPHIPDTFPCQECEDAEAQSAPQDASARVANWCFRRPGSHRSVPDDWNRAARGEEDKMVIRGGAGSNARAMQKCIQRPYWHKKTPGREVIFERAAEAVADDLCSSPAVRVMVEGTCCVNPHTSRHFGEGGEPLRYAQFYPDDVSTRGGAGGSSGKASRQCHIDPFANDHGYNDRARLRGGYLEAAERAPTAKPVKQCNTMCVRTWCHKSGKRYQFGRDGDEEELDADYVGPTKVIARAFQHCPSDRRNERHVNDRLGHRAVDDDLELRGGYLSDTDALDSPVQVNEAGKIKPNVLGMCQGNIFHPIHNARRPRIIVSCFCVQSHVPPFHMGPFSKWAMQNIDIDDIL